MVFHRKKSADLSVGTKPPSTGWCDWCAACISARLWSCSRPSTRRRMRCARGSANVALTRARVRSAWWWHRHKVGKNRGAARARKHLLAPHARAASVSIMTPGLPGSRAPRARSRYAQTAPTPDQVFESARVSRRPARWSASPGFDSRAGPLSCGRRACCALSRHSLAQ